MSRFIKLTHAVLNTKDIHKIIIHPTQYFIHMNNGMFTGNIWLVAGSGIGNINNTPHYISVCKKEHPVDYDVIHRWIYNDYDVFK